MLDFALHGWDLVDALGLSRPHLAGHSMGGMIAAEMALPGAARPRQAGAGGPGRALDGRAPDPGHLRACCPISSPRCSSTIPQKGQALLTGGADLSDMEALKDFYIGYAAPACPWRARSCSRFPTADCPSACTGSPRRRWLVWGAADRLIVPAYAERWKATDPRRARGHRRERRATCCRTSSRTRSCERSATSWVEDALHARAPAWDLRSSPGTSGEIHA